MLGGAILILGSTTFLLCFLLPLILPLTLVPKEAKDEDRSSLDLVTFVFLENLGSWWRQQQEKRRK
jgi:hypothetical protein